MTLIPGPLPRLTLAVFLLSLPAALTPDALEAQGACERGWSAFQFLGENDAIAALSGSDEFYTNGLLFSLTRNPDCNPRWADRLSRKMWDILYRERPPDLFFTVELGHNIFTPSTLKSPVLLTDDRPYAAYLYIGALFVATDSLDAPQSQSSPVQQILEFQLGLVGPGAGGEWLQKRIHELIDDEEPQGWDTQLPNEPAFNAIYLWRKRIGGSNLDFVPHLGGALGTVQVYANGGGTVRAGWNISGFPVLTIRDTLLPGVREKLKKVEFYIFAGIDGRAVAHNLFLDGTVFRDSHSVDREPLVYDLKGGFSLRVRGFRFSYTFVRRSREFDPLPATSDDGRHDFGSLSLNFTRAF